MRIHNALVVSIYLLICGGCVSMPDSTAWVREAAITCGITEDDALVIGRIAVKRHKLVIGWFEKREDGGVDVYMHNTPDTPHGIVVVFRKIDGRWQEDPKSQDAWIV